MVKRSVLVALTLLLTLALSAAAFAAPETIISNQLTATIQADPQPTELELKWVTLPPETITVGKQFTAAVQLQNNTGQNFTSALVIVKVLKDGQPATRADFTATADGVALGYDSDGGYFFWGPREGFPIPDEYDATTAFDVTINNPGKYAVEIYVVDLAAETREPNNE